jgi:hypothetical protein
MLRIGNKLNMRGVDIRKKTSRAVSAIAGRRMIASEKTNRRWPIRGAIEPHAKPVPLMFSRETVSPDNLVVHAARDRT